MPPRAGMKSRTQPIFLRPEGARDMSFTILMFFLLGGRPPKCRARPRNPG